MANCPQCAIRNKEIQTLRERVRVLELEAQARQKLEGDNVIMITSLVSHRSQKPRVDIQLGELHTQLDTDAAVKIARDLLEVAAGAYADAFLFNFVREQLKQEDAVAGGILVQFREYREQLAREFEAMQKDKS